MDERSESVPFLYKYIQEYIICIYIYIIYFVDILFQFSQLIQIQRRLGSERFPLIEQSYFPNHRQMVSNLTKYYG